MTTELEKMRREQEKTLTETVYIQRLTRTGDDTGGWSEAWSTIATTTGRISIRRNTPREAETGGQMQYAQGFVITLPAATALEESDRLQVNGVQYVIKAILTHTEQTSLQVECVKA